MVIQTPDAVGSGRFEGIGLDEAADDFEITLVDSGLAW